MNVYAEWFMIMLTWLAPAIPTGGVEPVPAQIPLDRQEIPRYTEKHCEGTVRRLTKHWNKLPADDPFRYTLDCQLNPNYKPKGQRS